MNADQLADLAASHERAAEAAFDRCPIDTGQVVTHPGPCSTPEMCVRTNRHGNCVDCGYEPFSHDY